MRKTLILIFILFIQEFYAQSRISLHHKDAICYYDFPSNSFIIIDDSTFCWSYQLEKKVWEKKSIELELDVQFDLFLKFAPISKKGSNVYFVYPGCGVVYQKEGSKIKRVDQSFLQRNQLGGPIFLYTGKPHILGGFGLFSFKNFITYYDPFTREWYKLKTRGSMPPPLQLNNVIIEDHFLFLFNGFDMTDDIHSTLKKVYRLNLQTHLWEVLGNLNQEIRLTNISNTFLNSEMSKDDFHVFQKDLIQYDFTKNKYTRYHLDLDGVIRQFIQRNNYLCIMLKNSGSEDLFVEIKDRSFLKQYKKTSGVIYYPIAEKGFSSITLTYLFLAFFVILLISSLTYFKIKKRKNQSIWTTLNDSEYQLLNLLLENNDGIDINLVNEIISYGQPTIETLKKRREYLFKEFKRKMSQFFKVNQENVIIEKRMNTDKRMKVFKLEDQLKQKMMNHPKK